VAKIEKKIATRFTSPIPREGEDGQPLAGLGFVKKKKLKEKSFEKLRIISVESMQSMQYVHIYQTLEENEIISGSKLNKSIVKRLQVFSRYIPAVEKYA